MDQEMRTSRVPRVVKVLPQVFAGLLCGYAILVGIAYWYESDWGIDPRRERIEAEARLLGPTHPWAGTYYRGDGLGCNELLTIAPGDGYQYTNHGCLGLYGADHGSVALSGGRLVLWASVLCCPPLQRRELVIVDWGPRRYLVEPRQVLEFANSVNSRRADAPDELADFLGRIEDRSFYLRVGDEEKPIEGQPTLPTEFDRFVLRHPIEGHVAANRSQANRTSSAVEGAGLEVEVDLGGAQGVFAGMKLRMKEPGGAHDAATIVTRVEEQSSICRVEWCSFGHAPVAGWTVTSR
jgi:hypothetical protein